MTYKELLDFTRKNPNPFWNKEQHDKEFEYRHKAWIEQLDQKHDKKSAQTQYRNS